MKECPACRRCFSDEVNHCPQDGDATTPSLLGEPILDARYQLERRLGQGGMGVVFQARHIFLKTSHAIKVILPDLVGNDPMLVTRFRQEALAAAAIRHQNIIAVTDFGVVRGTMPFLVMEFVSGQSLQEILAEEKVMGPERALEFACAIAAGVGAAHKQNIVHRDLKPLNIMMQQGQSISEGLKILDFGLAKIKSGELLGSFVQAKTSGLMGSPFYMAPEQWSDDEPDARADVYSLGIILYQMLTGDVPFKGSSIPAIMKKHLTLPPPSFKSTGIEVSPQLEAAVRHALEKEITARTPSVEAFVAELKEAVAVGGLGVKGGRATAPVIDETMYSPSTKTGETSQPSQSGAAFDSSAGTVSSTALSPEDQAKLAAAREAYEREQREKERVAHEELTRESEERRKAAE
ncbi:MAG TPA: protein kinase, partial [Pyrinomonadaceae bacterium]|nr:protein kinase [Pyrinomonadaceae bacterium]